MTVQRPSIGISRKRRKVACRLHVAARLRSSSEEHWCPAVDAATAHVAKVMVVVLYE